jgi:hypothetical protein
MHLVRTAAALALLLTMSAGAVAAPKKGEPAWDPNREVCKSRAAIGSRLQRIRECHTAQQWEEMKQQEQQGLMRKQYNGAPGCRDCPGG